MPLLRFAAWSLCGTFALPAQTFEVASIKPNAANDHRVSIQMQPGGRFVATGIPIRLLIGLAYNMRDFQITGGPSWINGQFYDVNAKAETTKDRLTIEDMRPMFKALLADRFGLKAHEETKELQVYELVNGKSGNKLTPSAGGQNDRQMRMGRGQLNAKGVTMAALAQQLSQQLGRTVIDKTGLSGAFDVDLQWTPEPGQGGMGHFGGPPPGAALPPVDSSGPSLFTAVQEQLGLRLESAKGPVPVLVIESMNKPTEN